MWCSTVLLQYCSALVLQFYLPFLLLSIMVLHWNFGAVVLCSSAMDMQSYCAAVFLICSAIVPQSTVLLGCSAMVLKYYGSIHSAMDLQCYESAVLLCCSAMNLQCYDAAVLWICSSLVLQWYWAAVLLSWSAMYLQYYVAAVLLCCSAMLLHCYGAAVLMCLCATDLQCCWALLSLCLDKQCIWVYELWVLHTYIQTELMLEVLADLKI